MNGKLTLSIRAEVIARAKEWARREGKSLSSVVEEYLDKMTRQSSQKKSALDIIREMGTQMADQAISDEDVAARIHHQRMKH